MLWYFECYRDKNETSFTELMKYMLMGYGHLQNLHLRSNRIIYVTTVNISCSENTTSIAINLFQHTQFGLKKCYTWRQYIPCSTCWDKSHVQLSVFTMSPKMPSEHNMVTPEVEIPSGALLGTTVTSETPWPTAMTSLTPGVYSLI